MLAAALASDRAKPLEREVQKMRLVKSTRELSLMKDAADLSADAHAKVCSVFVGFRMKLILIIGDEIC
jgi:intermediate cleaving peptidase 55